MLRNHRRKSTFLSHAPALRRQASIRRCIRLAKLHSIYTVIISRMPLMRPLTPFSHLPRSLEPTFRRARSPRRKNATDHVPRQVRTCLYHFLIARNVGEKMRACKRQCVREAATSKYYRTARIYVIHVCYSSGEKAGEKWSHLNPRIFYYPLFSSF